MPLFGAGKDPREVVIEALQAEIARAQEREKLLLVQISDLVNKLSAHADTKAHVAATQPRRERPPEEPVRRTLKLPAGYATSARKGHINLTAMRQKLNGPAKPAGLPPQIPE